MQYKAYEDALSEEEKKMQNRKYFFLVSNSGIT